MTRHDQVRHCRDCPLDRVSDRQVVDFGIKERHPPPVVKQRAANRQEPQWHLLTHAVEAGDRVIGRVDEEDVHLDLPCDTPRHVYTQGLSKDERLLAIRNWIWGVS